ncbi:MAG: hypothetical protein JWM32_1758 [Verrucomicrobia bacterium]|nr:hypothetical protein [Verrucomicrobiota bacterium]
MISRFLWPVCCALLVLLFVGAVARFYHPVYGFTSLIQFDATNEFTMVKEARERPVFINHKSTGYDGLYYAQLAAHPLLRDPALPVAMDNLGYRARRIFASWTAWALALGNRTRALDAYALLNPVCWLGLAALLFNFFPPRSAHDFVAWAGLLFSAGALTSVRFALTDLPALLLLTGVMFAATRGKLNRAVGLLAAAGLTRETSLLAAPVLVSGSRLKGFARVALAVIPLVLWLAYVRQVAGASDSGWGNFAWPGTKFLEKWQATLNGFDRPDLALLNWTTLLALLALTVQAAWLIARPQWHDLWWRFGIGYAALLLLLGTAVWEGHPGAATRVLLPLNLAFNLLMPRTRLGLALLILGNLSVPAGLVQFASLPNDGIELAAARVDDRTILVQTAKGWSGVERDSKQFWAWSTGDAEVAIRARPGPISLVMNFRVRGLRPQTLEISQDGKSLWRGKVGAGWQPVRIACVDGLVSFKTDTPPVLEGDQPGARRLGFCLSQTELSEIQSIPARNTAPPSR